ncbi:minor capsid protein [Anaerofustis stercorihominis]|uniref:minor capsid protein n=1 Tax=Anaerofustis stercorihominis TaxID=214853 RepID=UPI0039967C61
MKNSNYWQKRFELLENERYKTILEYQEQIENAYTSATKEIEKDIAHWYMRFSVNNKISYAEAKKLLKSDELKELKWTLHEYIKKGKENSINQKWIKELENASAKYHISRYEALKLELDNYVETLLSNENSTLEETLRGMYTNTYYKNTYEISKGINTGINLYSLADDFVFAAITTPWATDGLNFSDRIWKNKDKLINTLNTVFSQSLIRGEAPDKTARKIADKLNVSKNNAKRLVLTESAAISAKATKKTYDDLNVDKYKILATLDTRTSEICRYMDGKIFDKKDYQVGINAPPFHCNCRTTTVPVIDDEIFKDSKRIAKDKNGKNIYVPRDMTYEEWYNKYILDDVQISDIKAIYSNEDKLLYNKLTKAHEDVLKYGLKTGSEKVVYIDVNNNKRIFTNTGNKNKVYSSEDILRTAKDSSIIAIHNHPSNGSFSGDDLILINKYKSIKSASIQAHDGTVYKITVGNGERLNDKMAEYFLRKNLNNSFKNGVKNIDDYIKLSDYLVGKICKMMRWKYEKR